VIIGVYFIKYARKFLAFKLGMNGIFEAKTGDTVAEVVQSFKGERSRGDKERVSGAGGVFVGR
jgi:hypothetical protein